MMRRFITYTCLLLCLCLPPFWGHAQIAVNNTGNPPDSNAILDISSTGKGLLIPRLTTAQRKTINNPPNGLMVFDTDQQALATYTNSSGWAMLQEETTGRVHVSDRYPDPLYPTNRYDYLGSTGRMSRYNLGFFPGQWVTKYSYSPVPGFSFSMSNRKLLYTGTADNRILCVGPESVVVSDSSIGIYNLSTDSAYKDPTAHIARYGGFTATIDTAHTRIFIYGGVPKIEFNQQTGAQIYNPEYKGYIYNYNTGVKEPIDTATCPISYKRSDHCAVWAGAQGRLYVWGGELVQGNIGVMTTAFLSYRPSHRLWASLAPCPLSARFAPMAVYDGSDRILVFGGRNGTGSAFYSDGAIYNISTDTWTMMSTANAPTTGMHSISWTGTEMIVSNNNSLNGSEPYTAYRYNPNTNVWVKLPDIPMVNGVSHLGVTNHVWTGTELAQITTLSGSNVVKMLWKYNMASNTWASYSTNDVIQGSQGLRGMLVQAGNNTVFNSSYGNIYCRFSPTGGGLLFSDVGGAFLHYYKRR